MADQLPRLSDLVGKGQAAKATPNAGLPSLSDLVGKGGGRQKFKEKPKQKHHGGFMSSLRKYSGADIIGKAESDLYHTAVNTPAGAYFAGKAVVDANRGNSKPLTELAKGQAKQYKEDFRHPLRHPGYTALDLLGVASVGAGGAARLGALGKLAREGGSLSDAARVVRHGPEPGVRTFKSGDLEVTQPASRSASTRYAQRLNDARRNRAAAKNPTGYNARKIEKKAGKALEETMRHEESIAKAPAEVLHKLGQQLKPHENWALRLVAEEAPVEKRIATLERQVSAAKGGKRRRLEKRLELTRQAQPLLVEKDGRPAFTSPKLQQVYDQMSQVSGTRERLAKDLGLLTDDMIHGRKTNAGRVAMGAAYENPTPGKLGKSPALDRAQANVDRLQRRFDAMSKKQSGRYVTVTKPRSVEGAKAELARLDAEHQTALTKLGTEMFGNADRREVNFRTQENRRANRQASGRTKAGGLSGASGPKSTLRKTVKQEQRDRAEAAVLEAIKKNPDHPTSRKWAQRMETIDTLRRALEPEFLDKVDPKKLGRSESLAFKPRTGNLERVGGALSVAKDRVERLQVAAEKRQKPTGIIGHENFKASPNAVYVPDSEPRTGGSGRVTSMGAQGTIGTPQNPVKYGYTGEAKRQGREPLKTTKAVAQSNLAITRYHRILNIRGKLIKAASPQPRFKNDIAIRLDKLGSHEKLPVDVRKFVDNPSELAPDDAVRMFEKLRKNVILAPENAAEFEKLHAEGKIGWVPKRLLGDLAHPAAPLSSVVGKVPVAVLDGINNAQRLAILYLKPAYAAPNIIGNAALTVIQQGFAAPRNVAFASRMHWTLGPDLTARVDAMVGEGVAASLQGEAGVGAKATQGLSHVWSKGVDRPFRRAAFFHEAKMAGYKTPHELEKLLTDPAAHEDLINVTKRANRELIDYGRLSSRERQVIRRIIFFYPWVKGSTMYAGHFLAEHPIKADVAGHIGAYGKQKAEESTGPVPSNLEGAFRAGGGLVNPSSAGIFGTPAQVGRVATGLVTGDTSRVARGSGLLTPALSLAMALATRQDPGTGYQYKKGENIAQDQLVGGLPQMSLIQGLRGKQTSKTYKDNRRSVLGKFLAGGLYPRPYNPGMLHKSAAKEKSGR